MYDKVFGSMALPVEFRMYANGATLTQIDEPVTQAVATEAFFGGYAEDLLAGIGMDAVDEQPQASAKAKRA